MEKFYYLEEKQEIPNEEIYVWQGKPAFFPFILTKEFLEIIVLLLIFLYFEFTFFFFTNLLLFIFVIRCGINLYKYFTIQYYITTTHFVLQRGKKAYYYPISKLDNKDFKVHFNIFDFLFGCKTITYASCKLMEVPQNIAVVLHRNSTGNTNIWYQKTKFSHIKDYKFIDKFINTEY